MAERDSPTFTLRLIALLRLGKALVLAAGSVGVLQLLDPGVAHRVEAWLAALPFVVRHPELHRAAHRLTDASPRRLEIVAAAGAAYAVLFAVEGVGLWLREVWAEYLTMVATASFVPVEVYE